MPAALSMAAQLALLALAFFLAAGARYDFALHAPATGAAWFTGAFLRLLPLVLAVKLLVWDRAASGRGRMAPLHAVSGRT